MGARTVSSGHSGDELQYPASSIYEEELSLLRAQNEALASQLNSVNAELEEAKGEKAERVSRIESLEASVNDYALQVNSLSNQLQSYQALESKVVYLEDLVNKFEVERSTNVEEIKVRSEREESLKSEVEMYKMQLEDKINRSSLSMGVVFQDSISPQPDENGLDESMTELNADDNKLAITALENEIERYQAFVSKVQEQMAPSFVGEEYRLSSDHRENLHVLESEIGRLLSDRDLMGSQIDQFKTDLLFEREKSKSMLDAKYADEETIRELQEQIASLTEQMKSRQAQKVDEWSWEADTTVPRSTNPNNDNEHVTATLPEPDNLLTTAIENTENEGWDWNEEAISGSQLDEMKDNSTPVLVDNQSDVALAASQQTSMAVKFDPPQEKSEDDEWGWEEDGGFAADDVHDENEDKANTLVGLPSSANNFAEETSNVQLPSQQYRNDLALLNEKLNIAESGRLEILQQLESSLKENESLKAKLIQQEAAKEADIDEVKHDAEITSTLKSRIQDLIVEKERLQNDVESLRALLNDAEEERQMLITQLSALLDSDAQESLTVQEYLSQLEVLISDLRSEIAAKDEKEAQIIEKAKEKFSSLVEERDDLVSQNQSLREAGNSVLETLKKLEEENDSLVAENETLLAEKDQLLIANEQLENKCLSLTENSIYVETETGSLQERITFLENANLLLEQEKDANKSEIEALKTESDLIKERLNEAQNLASQCQQKIANIEAEAGDRADAVALKESLLAQNEELLSRISHFEKDFLELGEKLKASEHDAEILRSKLSEYESQIETLKSTGLEVLQHRENLLLENDDLVAQITALKEAGAVVVSARERLEEEADSLACQVDELTAKLSLLNDEKSGLLAELDDARTNLSSLTLKLTAETERAECLQRSYKELEFKSAADAQDLVDTLRNVTEDASDLKQELKSLRSQLEEVSSEKATIIEARDQLQLAKDEEEQKCTQLLSEIATLTHDVSTLKENNESLTSQLAHYENELNQLYQESQELKDELAKGNSVDSSSNQEELKGLHERLNEAEARYEELLEAGEKHSLNLESQIDHLTAEVEYLRIEHSNLTAEVSELHRKLEMAESSMNDRSNEMLSVSEEVEHLRSLVAAKELAIEELLLKLKYESEESLTWKAALQSKDDQLNETLAKSTELESLVATLESELKFQSENASQLEATLHDETSRREQIESLYSTEVAKVSNLEIEIQTSLSKIAESEEHLTLLTEEIQGLKSQLMRAEVDRQDAESRLNAFTSDYESSMKSKDEVISDLENQLQGAQQFTSVSVEEHDILKEKVDEQSRYLSEYTGRIDILEQQISDYTHQLSEKTTALLSLETQINEAHQQLNLISSERDEANYHVKRLEADLEKISQEQSGLYEQIKHYSDLHTIAQDNVQALEENLNAAHAERDELANANVEISTQLSTFESERQYLERSVEEYRGRVEHLELLLKTAREQSEQAESHGKELEQAILSVQNESSSIQCSLQGQIADLERQSSEASEKIAFLEGELMRTNEQLALHMSQRESKIDMLSKQIESLTKSHRESEEAASERLAGAFQETEYWKKTADDVKEAFESYKASFDSNEIEQKVADIYEFQKKAMEQKLETTLDEKKQIEKELQNLKEKVEKEKTDMAAMGAYDKSMKGIEVRQQDRNTVSLKESPVNMDALLGLFISKVDSYQSKMPALLNLRDELLSKLKVLNPAMTTTMRDLISSLQTVEQQYQSLDKQTAYLSSLLQRSLPHLPDQHPPTIQITPDTKTPSADQDMKGSGYTLSSKEYAELVTKAGKVDYYKQQVENTQSLMAEHVKEIQILKAALEETVGSVADGVPESGPVRLLQRHIDELKKVWSHELAANMILRNLIAKTQAESMVAEQEARRQQIRLREEFDDLVALFEETQKDNSAQSVEADKAMLTAERNLEEKLNRQFFELEQQHQEQTQQLEEMYDKERTALNKLVANLEKERNRVISELSAVKTTLGEKLADAISASEATARRLIDAERAKDSIERDYNIARDDILRLQEDLRKSRLETKKAQDELMGFYARSSVDKVASEAWTHERRELIRRISDLEQRERGLLDEIQSMQIRLHRHDRGVDTDRSDKVRLIRSEVENLQRVLLHRDAQIRTLEGRIQELLQGDRYNISESNYRPAEIETLHEQMLSIDEARKRAEDQYYYEKDRSKRLAVRVEELKRRLLQQQHLLQQQDETINSAIRPGLRGADPPLRDDVMNLRKELAQSQRVTNEIVMIVSETLVNVFGASLRNKLGSQKFVIAKIRRFMTSLTEEVIHLRALVNRVSIWRADLRYQKVYLSLRIDDLLASQKATFKFIEGMGLTPPPAQETAEKLSPIRKLKSCVTVLISVYRMM
ncbi:hypothetical protein HDV05_003914 [Chytridiales sp. JEL 0842]|nr:hypothetical protein HDV05_003914 [Chytridiales sp. JEL 0842]